MRDASLSFRSRVDLRLLCSFFSYDPDTISGPLSSVLTLKQKNSRKSEGERDRARLLSKPLLRAHPARRLSPPTIHVIPPLPSSPSHSSLSPASSSSSQQPHPPSLAHSNLSNLLSTPSSRHPPLLPLQPPSSLLLLLDISTTAETKPRSLCSSTYSLCKCCYYVLDGSAEEGTRGGRGRRVVVEGGQRECEEE